MVAWLLRFTDSINKASKLSLLSNQTNGYKCDHPRRREIVVERDKHSMIWLVYDNPVELNISFSSNVLKPGVSFSINH